MSKLDQLVMNFIDDAPKDGRKIILIWETPHDDMRAFNIREGYWEDFTYLPDDRRLKVEPCWKYINDADFIMEVKNPIGWLPLPLLQPKTQVT